MNAEQLKGEWMQFKGELKESGASLRTMISRRSEGTTTDLFGKVQERYGDKKRELMKWADQWYHKAPPARRGKRSSDRNRLMRDGYSQLTVMNAVTRGGVR